MKNKVNFENVQTPQGGCRHALLLNKKHIHYRRQRYKIRYGVYVRQTEHIIFSHKIGGFFFFDFVFMFVLLIFLFVSDRQSLYTYW